MVEWLRLYAPTAEGIDSGWGTKIRMPYAMAKKKKKNEGIKKELKERKEEKSISES